ncbi:MAG: hypothetical protein K6G08_04255 [Prevotella sp.]|nr:hypothetical protein [Prevotella sp.]
MVDVDIRRVYRRTLEAMVSYANHGNLDSPLFVSTKATIPLYNLTFSRARTSVVLTFSKPGTRSRQIRKN